MKKFILLSILTFLIYQVSFAQQYGWQLIDPTSISGSPDFSDVHTVSENVALISSSSVANIYRTDDGATTFFPQATSLGTTTEAIHMINNTTGFCGGASGFVYNTGDGGTNWGFLGTMATTLTDMDFVSASQGYACGDGGAVFSIGGTVNNLNSGQAIPFSGISSSSVDNVWVCGGSSILFYNGLTFAFQAGPAGSYNDIFFLNDQEGWVVGNNGLIGYTVNGGDTWTQQTNPDSNSLYGVFFLTQNIGWAVGSQGTILYTANGGDTWTVQGAGHTTAFLRGVHFVSTNNGNVGYVVGNGKTLLKYGEITNSVEEIESIQFEIYPNPTQNIIQIYCSEFKTENGIIEILSLDGKKILEKEIEKGIENIELDLKNLKSGMYFCKISTDKKSSTKKMIKE